MMRPDFYVSGAAVGLVVALLPGGAALAEGTCGTAEAWVAWQQQNGSALMAAEGHMGTAIRQAKKKKWTKATYRKVSDNIFAAGEHYRTVTASPDGVAGSLLNKAGKDLVYASQAFNNGRLKVFKRKFSAGLDEVDAGVEAANACLAQVGTPTG